MVAPVVVLSEAKLRVAGEWQIDQIRQFAAGYLSGAGSPLETAISIHATLAWDDAPQELQEPLLALTGVVSQTDEILLGERRQLWHPDVRAEQDRKHDDAQAWAAPLVREACQQIMAATTT